MEQLLDTLISVAVAIGATVGGFVLLNALVDQAPRRFWLFATVSGALVGALLGAVANSGGWFIGGSLWPWGGAVVGAALGGLVWARHPPPVERRRRIPDRLRPAIFLAPALLFLGVTLVVPTIRTIYLSFRSRRGEEFAGLDNYDGVFGDSNIFNTDGFGGILTSRLFVIAVVVAVLAVGVTAWRGLSSRRGVDLSAPVPFSGLAVAGILVALAGVGSLTGVIWNNVFWVLFVTVGATGLGLAIAVLADRSKGESLAKSLIFMPMAISFVGASVIWRFVYAFTPANRDQIGLLNAAWVGLGNDPEAWLQQPPWNSMFLIVIMIWIQTGFAMVVLSSAIKAVPGELHEAARVDGASEAQAFWRVIRTPIRT